MADAEEERAEDAAASIVGRGELFEHLFSYLMGNAVSEFLTTEMVETEKREACYHRCISVSELKATLTTMAGASKRRKTGG
jgi:hypothetical protein